MVGPSLGDGEDTGKRHEADEDCQRACRLTTKVIPRRDSRRGLSLNCEVTPMRRVGSTAMEETVVSGRKIGGEGNSTNERRGQSKAVLASPWSISTTESGRGWQGPPCTGHEDAGTLIRIVYMNLARRQICCVLRRI